MGSGNDLSSVSSLTFAMLGALAWQVAIPNEIIDFWSLGDRTRRFGPGSPFGVVLIFCFDSFIFRFVSLAQRSRSKTPLREGLWDMAYVLCGKLDGDAHGLVFSSGRAPQRR